MTTRDAGELVERLRFMADQGDYGRPPDPTDVRRRAADEIERLRAQLAEARGAAVKEVADWLQWSDGQEIEDLCDALHAEIKKQREAGHFIGQPYIDLFAAAIRTLGGDRKL